MHIHIYIHTQLHINIKASWDEIKIFTPNYNKSMKKRPGSITLS